MKAGQKALPVAVQAPPTATAVAQVPCPLQTASLAQSPASMHTIPCSQVVHQPLTSSHPVNMSKNNRSWSSIKTTGRLAAQADRIIPSLQVSVSIRLNTVYNTMLKCFCYLLCWGKRGGGGGGELTVCNKHLQVAYHCSCKCCPLPVGLHSGSQRCRQAS